MRNMDNLRIRKVQVNVKGSLIEYDEYYLVDDNACKYNKIGNRKEEIRSNISKLRSILRDVERVISDLTRAIESYEEE